MQVATDYIRHAARAARKCAGDPLGGAPQSPDAEFYKTLAKALEEIAAGLDTPSKQEGATSAHPRRWPKRLQPCRGSRSLPSRPRRRASTAITTASSSF